VHAGDKKQKRTSCCSVQTDLNMGRNMQTKKKTPAMAKQCLGRFLMPAQHQEGMLSSDINCKIKRKNFFFFP